MKKLLLFLFLSFSLSAQALSHEPLQVDQAFQFSAMAKDNQTLIAHWEIAPGYYLYRARIHVQPINPEISSLGPLWMPTGISKTDAELGRYQVYENSLNIVIPIIKSSESFITLKIDYQGCSEFGYCYPPTEKVVRLNLEGDYLKAVQALNIDIAPKANPTLSKQDKISSLLSTQHPAWILLAFLGFGILISLTPCVLPMIPILSSIIMGQKNLTRRHSFLLALSYVLGMAFTYAIVGILFGLIGANLQSLLQKPFIIIAFSLLFIAMALSLFGLYDLQLPESLRSRLQDVSAGQRRGTYLGAMLMGVLSTLIVSPCVTAPLVGVLGFISESGNMLLGGTALFVMGLGMGLPLLIIGSTGHLFLKTGGWMNRMKQLLGIIMLGVAIYMLSRVLAAPWIMILWIALALATGILLGALNSATNLSAKISKAFGLIFCVYAIAASMSLIAGNTNPLHPWISKAAPAHSIHFIPVKNVAEVKSQIAAANGKPVLLDFYADWCVACKEMDHLTFANSEVQEQLKSWVLLRADVTANDEEDKALSKYFQVVAPPTIIFFNSKGQNLPQSKLVGEASASELLDNIKGIK